jgi:electron transfer flavoprotein alpha subunit
VFCCRFLQVSTLVVVEHKSGQVAAPTLNTVSAATQLGGDVTALVGGSGIQAVAEQASKIPGVSKASEAGFEVLRGAVSKPVTACVH